MLFQNYVVRYGFARVFFVPYPSKLHVGVCKPGWPSGCEGGRPYLFQTMLFFSPWLCYGFSFLTQASSMLEFVNQSGRLVVRGEASVFSNNVALQSMALLGLLCCSFPRQALRWSL